MKTDLKKNVVDELKNKVREILEELSNPWIHHEDKAALTRQLSSVLDQIKKIELLYI